MKLPKPSEVYKPYYISVEALYGLSWQPISLSWIGTDPKLSIGQIVLYFRCGLVNLREVGNEVA